jgi:hypothetical protein
MGAVSILESGTDVTITIDGNAGDIHVGGAGQPGQLTLRTQDGQALTTVSPGQVVLFGPEGQQRFFLGAIGANCVIGGPGRGGELHLLPNRRSGPAEPTISLDGDTGNLILKTGGSASIRLDGEKAALFLGGAQQAGDAVLRSAAGSDTIRLEGDTGNLVLTAGAGATIRLDGQQADLFLGGATQDGRVVLRRGNGQDALVLDARQAHVRVGGAGADGDLVVYPAGVANDAPADMASIHLSGDGSSIVIRSGGQETIRLDGQQGDIILANADGAEEFEVCDPGVEPGTVLIIEDESRMRISDRAYDRRVAGIVSGAAGIKPGIVLGRGQSGVRVPVALFGKVNCRVDASYGAVAPGDLLTTSDTPGHAMRVEPGVPAVGTVIGKALSALASGRGFVPVLVALQ